MAATLTRIPESEQTFGQAIRWAREQRRMTLRALAAAVGVSAPFQSDLEHDRRETIKVAEYAAVLRVHLEDLEARQGLTANLKDWLSGQPELLRLLQEIHGRRVGPLVLLGGKARNRCKHLRARSIVCMVQDGINEKPVQDFRTDGYTVKWCPQCGSLLARHPKRYALLTRPMWRKPTGDGP